MRTLKITALRLLLEEQEYPDEWWVCIDGNVNSATHCISGVEATGEVLLMNAAVRGTNKEEWIRFDYPNKKKPGRNYTVKMGNGERAKGPHCSPTYNQLKLLTALGGLQIKHYTRAEASKEIDLYKRKNDPNWSILDSQDLRLKAVVALSIPIELPENVEEYSVAGFEVFTSDSDYTWNHLWPAGPAFLEMLDCAGVLKNTAYRLSDARSILCKAIEEGTELSESIGKLERHRVLILNAWRKSIERAITELEEFKREAGLDLDMEQCLEDEIESLHDSLEEAEDDLQEAKILASERIPTWRDEVYDYFGFDSFDGGIRKPTLKQMKECISDLDEREPDWEVSPDDDGVSVLLEHLQKMYPELAHPRSSCAPMARSEVTKKKPREFPAKKVAKRVYGRPRKGLFDGPILEGHTFKNKMVLVAALLLWVAALLRIILRWP